MIRLSGTGHACAPRGAGEVAGFDFAEQPYLSNVYPGETRSIGIVFCIRTWPSSTSTWGEPHLPGELHRRPRTGKAQGLHHYRGLHPLRRLCGGLPPAGHHLGRAQRPSTRSTASTCGNCVEHCPVAAVIPREQGDRPSGKLNEGLMWGYWRKSSHPTFLISPCGFSGRSRGILKLAKKSPVSHL